MDESPKSLQARVHELIPGGAHTYAKGDDQYPSCAPPFIVRGEGANVWDLEGRKFTEFGSGLRAVTLGHGYAEVVDAACDAMRRGTNFVRPAPIEVQCAEALLDLLPAADMVKFTKNGSDATTAAVKLARAHTGRPKVAICADQPFFSVDDWFIGNTALSAGVPAAIQALTLGFRFNDIDSLEALFQEHPDQIACVVLEAAWVEEPEPGFLPAVRKLCSDRGAVLVLDEMITGFRWHLGGAQEVYGVEPDLSTFGKGMANGFSVSALVGKREIMSLGDLEHSSERVFLLSTTHGAETSSLAACLATIGIYRRESVIEQLYRQGERLREGVRQAITAAGVEGHFDVRGRPCNMVYATRDQDERPSQEFRTLFMQELIGGGVLAPSFVVSFSHSDDHIDQTVDVVARALEVYRSALENGVRPLLRGPSVKPVFRRFN
jgi:glutamate-1-semialdehyde 2,1-aminomutase